MGSVHVELKLVLLLVAIHLSYSATFIPSKTHVLATKLNSAEAEALKAIGKKLRIKSWERGFDPCNPLYAQKDEELKEESGIESNVRCDCSFINSTCHIVTINLKGQNISANVPPEFSKFRYLQNLDLSRNLFTGSIPLQWTAMRLVELSFMGNRLCGPFPKVLTYITSLKNLSLEGNRILGHIPPEIGNLVNLERLIISSNALTGKLPTQLAKLTNLVDVRISDNNFTGKIPEFIGKWKKLHKLQMQGCSLEGPIPSSISALTNLTDLRISDLKGRESSFPQLYNMKSLKTLILRKCSIHGGIPGYIGHMSKLKTLDLSFNYLTGDIPETFIGLTKVDFLFLTGNKLTGRIPRWIRERNKNADISYNNFTREGSDVSECPRGSVNLVESFSSSADKFSKLQPCLKRDFPCAAKEQYYSMHINCGGKELNVSGTKYEADLEPRGASTFYTGQNWAFSSTGNFLDNDVDSDNYVYANTSALSNVTAADSALFRTARVSPLSLTYYGLCLMNGNYTVKLHFAEIIFTNNSTFYSLGMRLFDVYIQGKLVLKDFNIADEAGGTGISITKKFITLVTSNTLKIQFYWAGRGTTGIPRRGNYGPLISAISVDPNFKPPVIKGHKNHVMIVAGIAVILVLILLLILTVLRMKGYLGAKVSTDKELRGLDLQTGVYTLRQMKAATKNFDAANKVGEGGFGSVYKGVLSDGTLIAVKQLSSKSRQGNREFVNEIGVISALQHPNLVKLYGCCVEGNQLLLIYEYLENNCVSKALFGKDATKRLKLDWPTRRKICLGIAKGLAYLHEESMIKVVHRDIKTSNVLLDKDLNAKISDFGLAKLYEDETSHISTKVAGTIGYMAPEYAMRGYLTNKADVYSFGVVALEIVSGKSNTNYRPNEEFVYLLDWAYVLQERGELLELVDPNMDANYSTEEAMVMLNVALLCTNASPTLRPTMSQVVSMLEGRTMVQDLLSDPGFLAINSKVKAMRNHFWQHASQTHSFSNHGSFVYSNIKSEESDLLLRSPPIEND